MTGDLRRTDAVLFGTVTITVATGPFAVAVFAGFLAGRADGHPLSRRYAVAVPLVVPRYVGPVVPASVRRSVPVPRNRFGEVRIHERAVDRVRPGGDVGRRPGVRSDA